MLPYAKRADLGTSLALGDIGLVTQRDACCGSVVPSKVYGLMAAGRPILFVGPEERDTRPHYRDGLVAAGTLHAATLAGLTNLLLHLADHRQEVRAAGARGRQELLKHFDLPLGTARIAQILLHGSAAGLPNTTLLATISARPKNQSNSTHVRNEGPGLCTQTLL